MKCRSASFRLALVACLSLAALAPSAGWLGVARAQSAAQAGASPADAALFAPVNALYAGLQKVQQTDSGSFQQRAQALAPAVQSAYDLDTVLRSSVGASRYLALSDDERQKLADAFRNYTVARYVSNFTPGSNAKFTVSPDIRPSPVGSDRIVTTTIGGQSDAGTEIDYILRNENGAWKIVDVLLEGHISQAGVQHSDFSSVLASSGTSGLIDMLNSKVAQFSKD